MPHKTIRFAGRLGPVHWAISNENDTLCGKPMLSHNYASTREADQKDCEACLGVMRANRAKFGIASSQPKPGAKPRWNVKFKISMDVVVEVEADSYDAAMAEAGDLDMTEGWAKRKISLMLNDNRFEVEPIDAERI